jgi:hypothetical protein
MLNGAALARAMSSAKEVMDELGAVATTMG